MVDFALARFRPFLPSFPQLKAFFFIARVPKLTEEALGFRKSAPKKISARLFKFHLAQIYGLSQTLYKMAER